MRSFTVSVEGVAVSAVQDLIALVAPSTGSVAITGLEITSRTTTGAFAGRIISGYTTSGSGGPSVTPSQNDFGDTTAFGGTARRNDTTRATGGTALVHRAFEFQAQAGYIWMPPEAGYIWLRASRRLVVTLDVVPTATLSATLSFVSYG